MEVAVCYPPSLLRVWLLKVDRGAENLPSLREFFLISFVPMRNRGFGASPINFKVKLYELCKWLDK